MKTLIPSLLFSLGLAACNVEEFVRKNDDRYANPGAMDPPLTGVYSTYQFALLDRYRVTHDWVNTSACGYSALEQPGRTPGQRSNFYIVNDIYEDSGVTKQRGMHPAKDFNRFVHSVISEERHYKDVSGQQRVFPRKEIGYQPICFESWWISSHYLRMLLQKRNLKQLEQIFSERYPEGQWTWRSVNGRNWRVQELSTEKLRPRTGVGGPYRAWLLPLGDTGYTIAFEMGASRESLRYPESHLATERVLLHLIESVQIESLVK
jgi:hypothetical protein